MYSEVIKTSKPIVEEDTQKLQETVSKILDNVKSSGDKYLKQYYNKKYNTEFPSFLLTEKELSESKNKLTPDIIEALDFAIEKVSNFAKEQKQSIHEFEKEMLPGMIMGQRILPVASCGCYIPGGNYPNLASGLMTVIPAMIAGVERIVCCSPLDPEKGIHPGILYPLYKLGIKEVYGIGGANAIGVMAFGTESIAPVDLIVGPGNKWVTEAKRQVFGKVGIDFIAGPSEILVIADNTARTDIVAADLIAQCEHDVNARASLVTTDKDLAQNVSGEIEKQLKERTTREIAKPAWDNNGEIVFVKNLEDAAVYANEYAPEHLEVHTSDPKYLLPLLRNYGSLFLGENAAEVYADKTIGLNHVLPTGRAARYTGGLWVGMYLKSVTHMMMDAKTSLLAAKYTEIVTSFEGMDGHRHSAALRTKYLS